MFYLAVLAVMASFYSDEIFRFVNNQTRLSTGSAASESSSASANLVHTLEIPMRNDGHYWIDMTVDYQSVQFIVDTGASYVTLSHEDGQKLNIYLNESDYNIPVNTAAGRSTVAEININVMSFGIIELYNVKAFVAREGMLSVSLLGMNYLNKLERFEFSDQRLILEQ